MTRLYLESVFSFLWKLHILCRFPVQEAGKVSGRLIGRAGKDPGRLIGRPEVSGRLKEKRGSGGFLK